MTVKPRAELRGRGWSLSIQRLRFVPELSLSSNLGAAPLVASWRGRAILVVSRLAEGERMWLSVTAPINMKVSATVADGHTLADEPIKDRGGVVIHRFNRIAGETEKGLGRNNLPVFRSIENKGHSLALALGNMNQVSIIILDARDFDVAFGPAPPNAAAPAVYTGWLLP